MSREVLPAPEKLDGIRSCELAALIYTLGFVPVDRQMTIAQGDGFKGGRHGYWRFLPQHPQGKYDLRRVLENGIDPEQARKLAAQHGLTPAGGIPPAYREQAYIAAAFHNKRLLVEQVQFGTRLKLERVGFVYLFRRDGARAVEELPGREVLHGMMRAGTRRTNLAAAMATLGFEPLPLRGGAALSLTGTRIAHEGGAVEWLLPEVSADGKWQLAERLARWVDDAWCSRPENTDPIACIADAFWNLRALRNALRDAAVMVQVKNGDRSILLNRDAPDAVWQKGADFLKRR